MDEGKIPCSSGMFYNYDGLFGAMSSVDHMNYRAVPSLSPSSTNPFVPGFEPCIFDAGAPYAILENLLNREESTDSQQQDWRVAMDSSVESPSWRISGELPTFTAHAVELHRNSRCVPSVSLSQKRHSIDSHSTDSEEEEFADVCRLHISNAGYRSPKRSRAAQVHSLSEKRRRNRINDKMKALQLLIPNCTKTDKASILDEAIQYVKRLQHQIQMISQLESMSSTPQMFIRIPFFPRQEKPQMAAYAGREMGMEHMKQMPQAYTIPVLPLVEWPNLQNSPYPISHLPNSSNGNSASSCTGTSSSKSAETPFPL